MKFHFLLILAIVTIYACNNDEAKPVSAEPSKPEEMDISMSGDTIVPIFPGSVEVLSVQNTDIRNELNEPDTAYRVEGGEIFLRFYANKREDARIFINDLEGKTYKTLAAGRVKPGFNEFAFSSEPLPYGEWNLFVTFDIYADTIQVVRFVKTENPV